MTGPMRIFVTGCRGQLGTDLTREISRRGHLALGCDLPETDVTDPEAIRGAILDAAPDAVIHTAGWTAVDLAESKPDECRRVNVDGTKNVALACREGGCKLVNLSTDYVFGESGDDRPHKPDDPVLYPAGVYAQSKYEGERIALDLCPRTFNVRIAWAFGLHGKNFVSTMLRLSETHDTLRVVCDQIGTPTYTPDVSRLLVDMVETDRFGIYHATNEGGFISWYEFAREIFRLANRAVTVVPVTTEEYGAPAPRPHNSRLDKSKLETAGFKRLPDWRDALARFLAEREKG